MSQDKEYETFNRQSTSPISGATAVRGEDFERGGVKSAQVLMPSSTTTHTDSTIDTSLRLSQSIDPLSRSALTFPPSAQRRSVSTQTVSGDVRSDVRPISSGSSRRSPVRKTGTGSKIEGLDARRKKTTDASSGRSKGTLSPRSSIREETENNGKDSEDCHVQDRDISVDAKNISKAAQGGSLVPNPVFAFTWEGQFSTNKLQKRLGLTAKVIDEYYVLSWAIYRIALFLYFCDVSFVPLQYDVNQGSF